MNTSVPAKSTASENVIESPEGRVILVTVFDRQALYLVHLANVGTVDVLGQFQETAAKFGPCPVLRE
jgi:hypothetical protein